MTDEFSIHESEIDIPVGNATLQGNLRIPDNATGLVLFVHGSGSSRFSPRNRYVADLLNQAGLATLLFDLLTNEEHQIDQATLEYRFDIELLSRRTITATEFINQSTTIPNLPIGLFGASTGAAAALYAAGFLPKIVKAVVSRGGRPDLAMPILPEVTTPTLLIVGSLDTEVIKLNEKAKQAIQTECMLKIIPGATHLFEEPGTLELAADAAKNWFLNKLVLE